MLTVVFAFVLLRVMAMHVLVCVHVIVQPPPRMLLLVMVEVCVLCFCFDDALTSFFVSCALARMLDVHHSKTNSSGAPEVC